MSKDMQIRYGPVDASPVKSFFVHMLTRDIKLEEVNLGPPRIPRPRRARW
jgi:hypothetical protein